MKRFLKIFILVTSIIIMPLMTVNAASSIKISYNNKSYNYTDKQIKVVFNGKSINISGTPGILLSQTALVPYEEVFKNSSLGAACKLSNNTLTIAKGSKNIKLTVNSKTAYINGKKTTLSVAPTKVTYKSNNKSKILVPARAVTEALGYKYVWNSSTATSTISKPLDIKYDGKWYSYTSTQGKVTVDGKEINVSGMPSVIMNNTALVQAKAVFANSSIKATYKYDSKTKILTMTKGSNTVKITINSKTAYVNNKKTTMTTAAKEITNKANGNTYIMVPGQFVANALGYNYTWSNSTLTSTITTKKQTNVTKPVDNIVKNEVEYKEFFNWEIHNDYFENYDSIAKLSDSITITSNKTTSSNLAIEDTTNYDTTSDNMITSNINSIYSIVKEEILDGTEVYRIYSDTPMTSITATNEKSNSLIFDVANSTVLSEQIYSYETGIVNQITASNDYEMQSSNFEFSLNTSKVKYKAVLTENNCVLEITIYNNYINSISAGNAVDGEYITIDGIITPDTEITEDEENIYVEIPYTINGVGEQNAIISDSQCIKAVLSSSPITNSTLIVITKTANAEYFVSQNSTSVTIKLIDKNSMDYSISFLKPDGIDYSSITTNDLYLNKKYVITIPGDYVDFYHQNPIQYVRSSLKSIEVKLNSSGNTEIIIYTDAVKGFIVNELSDVFTVKIGTPKEIYKNIVVLDPGHGGTDPGAMYSGVNEKDLNFKVLYTYAKSYFDQNPNIKVYYIRTSDVFYTLSERAAFAKTVEADLFISLHNNAAAASAEGTEVYYSTDNNKTLSNGLNSKALAQIFSDNLASTIGTKNRGVRTAGFAVTKNNTVPAILIELAFMTNSSDMKKLKNEEFLKKSAKAIYDTTVKVFEQYPTGR